MAKERKSDGDDGGLVFTSPHGQLSTPETDRLVLEVIGRVADKWTMQVLEVLAERGRLRFTRVGEFVGDISQKMLTKTLRNMEADGFVQRTVHPEVPPRVEYELTELGRSLGAALCTLWQWAEDHHVELSAMRARLARR
ncbi:winged helix-turn-helix transcriptional regulator [Chitinasiproducens palmae]|uniref:DNA-binding transcriptional regulator, HxlR family n=1 Tax=Chitinasiproducens palmae TaxID=1770053 RepID=A0A1H2PNZ5_9BURK|nr:helix-turn-helix domain-containing protein [Chitinasiproducens palmae]SDV47986.1 DNA-binding transcriptional regulator, HxlR family [Chitinasiproducens palmae]